MMLPQLALLALAPASALCLATPAQQQNGLARRAVDWSKWKPGVSFQIILHNPIKAETVADIVPANADVWDIDLQHAVDYENIIPTLKVSRANGAPKVHCKRLTSDELTRLCLALSNSLRGRL